MSPAPSVSVGLPVFNGERYVHEAIESVLGQTLQDLELVICDNASTDGTAAICREYAARDRRVRYHRNRENIGAARNFNLAFALSGSPYFKWIAADDAIEPLFLERSLERLSSEPQTVAAGTGYVIVNEIDGTVHQPDFDHEFSAAHASQRLRKFFDQSIGAEHPVWALMRADVLRRTRLFEPFVGSDFLVVASMLVHGPVGHVPEPLNRLRVHSSAYSWKLRRENVGRDNMQGRAEATWWDPHRRHSAVQLPQWRLLGAYARLIATSPVPPSERMRMLMALVHPYGRRSAVILTKELAFAIGLGPPYIAVRDAHRRLVGSRWDASRRSEEGAI